VRAYARYHSTSFHTSGSIVPGAPISAKSVTARFRCRIESALLARESFEEAAAPPLIPL